MASDLPPSALTCSWSMESCSLWPLPFAVISLRFRLLRLNWIFCQTLMRITGIWRKERTAGTIYTSSAAGITTSSCGVRNVLKSFSLTLILSFDNFTALICVPHLFGGLASIHACSGASSAVELSEGRAEIGVGHLALNSSASRLCPIRLSQGMHCESCALSLLGCGRSLGCPPLLLSSDTTLRLKHSSSSCCIQIIIGVSVARSLVSRVDVILSDCSACASIVLKGCQSITYRIQIVCCLYNLVSCNRSGISKQTHLLL